ncbi:MAG: hypothetical protein JNK74_21025 [Candidatus Hydrogenedentes bacterium]|nr:hypothetical protein [Candidatus Hydrogenedentota bacterium]
MPKKSFQSLFTTLVLLFALGSMAYVVLSEGAASGAVDPAPASPVTELIVYYMDMGKDCTTCQNLEVYTREVLEAHFKNDLTRGRVEWRRVDVDLAANTHFVDEFRLYTKAVVLVRFEGGRQTEYRSLSRIWELVYDKEAYMNYVRGEVRAALDGREKAD